MYKNNFDMPYIAVQFMRKCFVLIGKSEYMFIQFKVIFRNPLNFIGMKE